MAAYWPRSNKAKKVVAIEEVGVGLVRGDCFGKLLLTECLGVSLCAPLRARARVCVCVCACVCVQVARLKAILQHPSFKNDPMEAIQNHLRVTRWEA
jgi:hypothetical protein